MNKSAFLSELADQLKSLPQGEKNRLLDYYSEIIDDRMDENMNEEEAVSGLGSVEDIAREALLDATPLYKLIVPRTSLSKSNKALLLLASPLLIIMFALLFLFYVTVWLVIAALFLLELSFILAGIAGVITSIVNFGDQLTFSLLMFFGGLICVAIGIFTFAPIKRISQKIMGLTIKVMRRIKSLFQKEVV